MGKLQDIKIKQELRPCMVNGRRALFHRWADSARPVTPLGVEVDENTPRYQLHNVHGIVEYADGTVARVWPSEIQFIDHSEFEAYAWPEMEVQARGHLPGHYPLRSTQPVVHLRAGSHKRLE